MARPGLNAVLIPIDDDLALADAIDTLAQNAELRARLGAASKMDAEEASLERLFELGRARAGGFLAAHKGDIGVRSSLDLVARFL